MINGFEITQQTIKRESGKDSRASSNQWVFKEMRNMVKYIRVQQIMIKMMANFE